MLPRKNRLAKTRDFKEIFRQGRSVKAQGIVLKFQNTKNKTSRFAVVVSKKVAQKAVRRNRIRRIINQALYENTDIPKIGLDAMLIILPEFKAESFQEARVLVQQLFYKARAIKLL